MLYRVVHVNSPQDFYIHEVDFRNDIQKRSMKYSEFDSVGLTDDAVINAGDHYMVWVDDDLLWYRAVVKQILPRNLYDVLLLDMGKNVVVNRSHLSEVGKIDLSEIAIRCAIFEVIPVNVKWKDEANKLLLDLTRNQPVKVKIFNRLKDSWEVDLLTTQIPEISVRLSLIKECLAKDNTKCEVKCASIKAENHLNKSHADDTCLSTKLEGMGSTQSDQMGIDFHEIKSNFDQFFEEAADFANALIPVKPKPKTVLCQPSQSKPIQGKKSIGVQAMVEDAAERANAVCAVKPAPKTVLCQPSQPKPIQGKKSIGVQVMVEDAAEPVNALFAVDPEPSVGLQQSLDFQDWGKATLAGPYQANDERFSPDTVEEQFPSVKIRETHMPAESDEAFDYCEALSNFPFLRLPIGLHMFKCSVSFVVSPTELYIEPQMKEFDFRYAEMERHIQGIHRKLLPLNSFKPKSPCLARYTMDQGWYRAIVLSHDPVTRTVDVLFIDYLNKEKLPVSDVKEWPAELYLWSLPFLKVQLHGMKVNTEISQKDMREELFNCLANRDLFARLRPVLCNTKEVNDDPKNLQIDLFATSKDSEPVYQELFKKEFFYYNCTCLNENKL